MRQGTEPLLTPSWRGVWQKLKKAQWAAATGAAAKAQAGEPDQLFFIPASSPLWWGQAGTFQPFLQDTHVTVLPCSGALGSKTTRNPPPRVPMSEGPLAAYTFSQQPLSCPVGIKAGLSFFLPSTLHQASGIQSTAREQNSCPVSCPSWEPQWDGKHRAFCKIKQLSQRLWSRVQSPLFPEGLHDHLGPWRLLHHRSLHLDVLVAETIVNKEQDPGDWNQVPVPDISGLSAWAIS